MLKYYDVRIPTLHLQEKLLSVIKLVCTVPQTNTGRWVENTKVYEKTLVKELGKIAL